MTGDQRAFTSNQKLTEQLDVAFALQAAGLGIWEINPTTNQVRWDERCQALVSLQQTDTIPFQEAIQYIHPDDLDHVLAAIERTTTFPSDEHFDQTYRTLGADNGKLRWVHFWGQAQFTPTGELLRFSGIAQEVTQHVLAQQALTQQQAQQRFLLQLADVLRPLNDPGIIYYQTACLVGHYLGANRVGYAEDQGDENTIVVRQNYVHGVADLQGTYQYADYGPLLDEFRAGRTVARSDIAHDPTLTPAQKDAHQRLQLGATLNKPLLKDGRLVAVLFIHFQQAHAWSADELNLLEQVAGQVVVTVERAQAEAALRQSEQRFQRMANSVPQAIWVTDAQGNAEFLNQWWVNYSGVPFEPATAWQIAADILHPEDGPRLVAAFRQAMQTGTPFEVEQRNRSASGEYRWFLNKGEPYHDPQTGQITQWIGISIDIDDRKRAEQALQESELRFRTSVEQAPAAMLVVKGPELLIEIANQAVLELMDHGGEVVGQPLEVVMPELVGQHLPAQCRAVMQTGTPYYGWGEAATVRRNGQLQTSYFNVSYTPLYQAGHIRGVMQVVTEVTGQVQAQQALLASETRYRQLAEHLEQQVMERTRELAVSSQQLQVSNQELLRSNQALKTANDDLRRSNDNLQQFAYVASHDLQEPLRKIQSFSTLLEQQSAGQLTEEGRQYLQRITSAGARMSALIKDLLTYSRIATRQQVFEQVSLAAILDQVCSTLELVIAERGAQLEVDDLPIVRGDESQLNQLLQNLLSNAIKFTPVGQTPQIHVQCFMRERHELPAGVQPTNNAARFVQLSVHDQGIGFDLKYLDRIFQRLHGKHEFAGTGVGLAICQRVVENHGGAITADSKPGAGATFCVYLPA